MKRLRIAENILSSVTGDVPNEYYLFIVKRSLIASRPILRLLSIGFHQLRLSTTSAGRVLFLFDALWYCVVMWKVYRGFCSLSSVFVQFQVALSLFFPFQTRPTSRPKCVLISSFPGEITVIFGESRKFAQGRLIKELDLLRY
jgi:hypothetical protein